MTRISLSDASAAARASYEFLWRAMASLDSLRVQSALHDDTKHYKPCRWEISLPPRGGYILTVHRDDGTSREAIRSTELAPAATPLDVWRALGQAESEAADILLADLRADAAARWGDARPVIAMPPIAPLPAWTQTYTGGIATALAPTPEMFRPRDLAHHLALTNRYRGATPFPYSVAQHVVHCTQWVRWVRRQQAAAALTAYDAAVEELATLLHDGGEAYLGDPPGPYMSAPEFAGYRAALHRLDRAIEVAFHLPAEAMTRPMVKAADRVLLATEAAAFFPERRRPRPWTLTREPWTGFAIPVMSWQEAEAVFLVELNRAMRALAEAEKG